MTMNLLARIKEDPVILLQLFVAMLLLIGVTAMVMALAGVFGRS